LTLVAGYIPRWFTCSAFAKSNPSKQ